MNPDDLLAEVKLREIESSNSVGSRKRSVATYT